MAAKRFGNESTPDTPDPPPSLLLSLSLSLFPSLSVALQIQRRLLTLIEMMYIELLLGLLLGGAQIPHQIREAARPRQSTRLLLGQLLGIARRAAPTARRVQRALARIVMIVAARAATVTGQIAMGIEYAAAALEQHIGRRLRARRGASSAAR